MKRFELINGNKKIIFKFPLSMDEISPSYLRAVSAGIHVADNYTLVALIYRETLGSIIIARKQSKKGLTSGVIPIFVKAGATTNDFNKKITIKSKLIIPASALMTAHHVASPLNTLSIDTFIKYLDQDTTVAQRYNNNYGNEECYFVEFKLVPNCEIVGYYNNTARAIPNTYLSIISMEPVIDDSSSSNSDISDSDSDSDSSDSSDSDSSDSSSNDW